MRTLLTLSLFFLPLATHAAPENFKELVGLFTGLIGLLIPLLFALALLVFLWGLAKAWIWGGGDEAGVEKGKQIALAGVIGLVVMSGVWGIVALLSRGILGV